MYQAVIRNDAAYDGVFFYGVKSTGIFCRPSCKSRKPLRENICFFQDTEEARKAGFRACKRCRSDLLKFEPVKELAEEIKNTIEQDAGRKTVDLHRVGVSERRSSTVFREMYDITPKRYRDQVRLKRAEKLLKETDKKITDIAYLSGYQSIATFNRMFKQETGQTPSGYRKKNR